MVGAVTKALLVLRAIVYHGVRNNGRFHFIFISHEQFRLVVGVLLLYDNGWGAGYVESGERVEVK